MKKAISKYVNNQTKTYQCHLNFSVVWLLWDVSHTLYAFEWLGILSMLKRLLFRCISFNPLLFQVFRIILNNEMENFLSVFALFCAFFTLSPLLHAIAPYRHPPSPLFEFIPPLPNIHYILLLPISSVNFTWRKRFRLPPKMFVVYVKKCCLLSVPMRPIWNFIRFVYLSTKWHFTNKNSHHFIHFLHTKSILRIASRREMGFFLLEGNIHFGAISAVALPTWDLFRALYRPWLLSIYFTCDNLWRVCDSFWKPYNCNPMTAIMIFVF